MLKFILPGAGLILGLAGYFLLAADFKSWLVVTFSIIAGVVIAAIPGFFKVADIKADDVTEANELAGKKKFRDI